MNELSFLKNNQSTVDPATQHSSFALGAFNAIAILGILMICAGIIALIYNKFKKIENNLPFIFGIGGVFVLATAKLSGFLIAFDPVASYSGNPISPALLLIIICATVHWLIGKTSCSRQGNDKK